MALAACFMKNSRISAKKLEIVEKNKIVRKDFFNPRGKELE
jgi:hypothetical protein